MIRPQSCPICRKPLPAPGQPNSNWFPFCSERCRQVDLFRWCEGKYAIVEPLGPTPDALPDETDDDGA